MKNITNKMQRTQKAAPLILAVRLFKGAGMGLEIIKDAILRENWRNFIDKTHIELRKAGINQIEFTEFKNDGSYGKAKTGIPATKWVFAQDSSSSWVEFELKPRTVKGKKYPQIEFYQYIKSTYMMKTRQVNKVTWDEEDRVSGNRNPDGQDIRIKIYMSNFEKADMKNTQWIKTMVEFIQTFQPIIQSYR